MSPVLNAFEEFDRLIADAATLAAVWVDLAGPDSSGPQWPYAVEAMVRRLEQGAADL